MAQKRNGIIINTTLDKETYALMEKMRGDLPRSKYFARLVREDKERQEKQKQLENVMKGFMTSHPDLFASIMQNGLEATNGVSDEELEAWRRGDYEN